ncbi:MAG: RNA polymerase sigma factor [Myxococcales bacterium]|nr:RNA polymerase sigma factor [Myxococcales bacterium]
MTAYLTAHPLLSVTYGVGRFENAGSQGGAGVSTGEPAGALAEFEARFREYESDVVRLCRRMLGADAAKDAAQEVFLRARQGFDGYDASRPFRPWLLGITGNLCIDLIRRRSREARLFDPRDFVNDDLVDSGPSPLRRALDAESRRRIQRALDRLPLKYRLPLLLRYLQDLDYERIGEILDVSVGQVGTLLFRARLKLREQLGGS